MFVLYEVVYQLQKYSRLVAHKGGMLLLFALVVYMTEVGVSNPYYKLFEGSLACVAFEIFISIGVIVDLQYSPIVILLAHIYCLIRYHTKYEDVPETLVPSFITPVVVHALT